LIIVFVFQPPVTSFPALRHDRRSKPKDRAVRKRFVDAACDARNRLAQAVNQALVARRFPAQVCRPVPRCNWETMDVSLSEQDQREHFAYCVQVFGGVTAASRRLGIDERALRRFISGERPFGPNLLADTAKALRLLIAEATAAEAEISGVIG